MRSLTRLFPALAGLTLAFAGATPVAQASTGTNAATAAAAWLKGQLTDDAMPGPFTPVDWGLTIDALLALRSTGTEPATADKVTANIAAHVDSYATGADFGMPDFEIGGATAKVLLAATASGADPAHFGGHDIRKRTLDLLAGSDAGGEEGWIMTRNPGSPPTGGNLFDQSLAVVGLARSGGVPEAAVGFLLKQQCDGGGFRLFPVAGGTPCAGAPATDQVPDVDATAMAVQALLADGDVGGANTRTAIGKGVAWLLSAQKADGSFQGSAVTDSSNTNSTGLAGQALAAAGKSAAADKAAVFVAHQQLTSANARAASKHVGAIAYTPQSLTDAESTGIPDNQLDQWRRATAQAMLALTQVPLGQIGNSGTTPPPPTNTPTPPQHSPSPTRSGTPLNHHRAAPSPTRHTSPAAATSSNGGHGGHLPFTGAPIAWLSALGGAGVLIGGLLLTATRLRRRFPTGSPARQGEPVSGRAGVTGSLHTGDDLLRAPKRGPLP